MPGTMKADGMPKPAVMSGTTQLPKRRGRPRKLIRWLRSSAQVAVPFLRSRTAGLALLPGVARGRGQFGAPWFSEASTEPIAGIAPGPLSLIAGLPPVPES